MCDKTRVAYTKRLSIDFVGLYKRLLSFLNFHYVRFLKKCLQKRLLFVVKRPWHCPLSNVRILFFYFLMSPRMRNSMLHMWFYA